MPFYLQGSPTFHWRSAFHKWWPEHKAYCDKQWWTASFCTLTYRDSHFPNMLFLLRALNVLLFCSINMASLWCRSSWCDKEKSHMHFFQKYTEKLYAFHCLSQCFIVVKRCYDHSNSYWKHFIGAGLQVRYHGGKHDRTQADMMLKSSTAWSTCSRRLCATSVHRTPRPKWPTSSSKATPNRTTPSWAYGGQLQTTTATRSNLVVILTFFFHSVLKWD